MIASVPTSSGRFVIERRKSNSLRKPCEWRHAGGSLEALVTHVFHGAESLLADPVLDAMAAI
jgi:hypothetical protein